MAEVAAGDPGGPDADEEVFGPAGPRDDARLGHRVTLVRVGHMVSGALNEDAPPFPRGGIELVDLECDLVLSFPDAGAQVFVQWAVTVGAEHDAALIQPVVHRQDRGTVPAGVGDPADLVPGDQPQALILVHHVDERGPAGAGGVLLARAF